jgi:hypothetical protein
MDGRLCSDEWENPRRPRNRPNGWLALLMARLGRRSIELGLGLTGEAERTGECVHRGTVRPRALGFEALDAALAEAGGLRQLGLRQTRTEPVFPEERAKGLGPSGIVHPAASNR